MKRRAMFMLATMVAALFLTSGVALAATIACSSSIIGACWGTAGDDDMLSSGGNDDMRGLEGNDTYRFGNAWGQDVILFETAGSDTLRFDAVGVALSIDLRNTAIPAEELLDVAGRLSYKVSTPLTGDVVIENAYGGSSFDDIKGNAGPNTLVGNAGNDTLVGNAGNDGVQGSGGADRMYGSYGDDTIYAIDSLRDEVIDCGRGTDTVYADQADSAIINLNCEKKTLFF